MSDDLLRTTHLGSGEVIVEPGDTMAGRPTYQVSEHTLLGAVIAAVGPSKVYDALDQMMQKKGSG